MDESTIPGMDEAGLIPLGDDPGEDDEHEFLIDVRCNPSGVLVGSVLHLGSGRRDSVQEWDDVMRIIRAVVWSGSDSAGPDGA
jgi:hypothetical protein